MLKFGRQKVPDTSDAGGRGARSSARASDPNDDLKRKARQRLIGAVILVLTAIIVVPMLLDSEPRPLGSDIAISIPSKDAPAAATPAGTQAGTPAPATTGAAPAAATPTPPATTAPSAAPANPATAPANVPPATGNTVAPVTAAAPIASAPLTEASKPTEAAKPAAKPAEAAKPEAAKPTPKPEAAKPEAKPAAAPKEADGDKALALLEGKPAAKTVANGKFIVQVGAFASEEKVKELQARLKTAGLSTYTEKVKTDAGERIRLRAGPFGTHADAESVLGKIKAAGINGAVIVQ